MEAVFETAYLPYYPYYISMKVSLRFNRSSMLVSNTAIGPNPSHDSSQPIGGKCTVADSEAAPVSDVRYDGATRPRTPTVSVGVDLVEHTVGEFFCGNLLRFGTVDGADSLREGVGQRREREREGEREGERERDYPKPNMPFLLILFPESICKHSDNKHQMLGPLPCGPIQILCKQFLIEFPHPAFIIHVT